MAEKTLTETVKLVEQIQAMLQSNNVEPSLDELQSLHNDFVEATASTNKRLRECDDLLQAGHRAEALQHGEMDPNLLEVVPVLDFPERSIWSDFVRRYGLPNPPEIKMDIAADLNAAYPVEQQLERLMRSHRLHALSQSPLSERIRIMRSIAKVDQGNAIWEEDLRAFERVRQSQLVNDLKVAAGAESVSALALLEQEARSPEWHDPPPDNLVNRIASTHAEIRARRAYAELEKLEQELNAAFSELNSDKARQLRQRWNVVAPIGIRAEDDPLLELVAPAFEWLEQEDQESRARSEHAEAVFQLEQALDGNLPRDELERLYYAASQFEREVPEILQRRMAERIRAMETHAARRSRLSIMGITTTIVVAGLLTGLLIFIRNQSNQLARNVNTLRNTIQSGDLSAARSMVDQMRDDSPDMYSDVQIQQLVGDLQSAEQQDQLRRTRRAQALEHARKLIQEGTWQSLGQAEEAVKQAEADSQAAEIAAVRQVQSALTNTRATLQEQTDSQYREALDRFRKDYENVDQTSLTDLTDLIRRGEDLRARPHVSSELKRATRSLLMRLNTWKLSAEQNVAEEKLLVRIDDAVGSRQRFRGRLEDFVKLYPATSRARGFQKTLQEVDLWKGHADWTSFLSTWSATGIASLDPDGASEAIARLDAVTQIHSGFPYARELARLRPHLEAIAKRMQDGKRVHLGLIDLLSEPVIKNLSVVQTLGQGGRRVSYYFEGAPQIREDRYIVSYFVDFVLQNPKGKTFRASEIANPRNGDQYDWTAPQSKFRKYALDQLAGITDQNWEGQFFSLIHWLQDKDDLMDPVLKVDIMRRVLDIATVGSEPLKRAFARHIELIDKTKIDFTVSWITPNDGDAESSRREARDLLTRLPALRNKARPSDVRRDIRTQLMAARNPRLVSTYTWIGWLDRNAAGQWKCRVNSRLLPSDARELFILHAESKDNVNYARIGAIRNDLAVVDEVEETLLMEGRPVYALN